MPERDEKVKHTFSDASYRIADGLWAVGTTMTTSSAVCQALGIDEPQTMIVVALDDDYYGRFDRALWQTLETWNRK